MKIKRVRHPKSETSAGKSCRGLFVVVSLFLLFLMSVLLATGCAKKNEYKDPSGEPDGSRDNTPVVLLPEQPGTEIYGNDQVKIDASHASDGYISVAWLGEPSKIKVQMTSGDWLTYTFDTKTDGSWNVFPFSSGDGHYVIGVYSNIEGTMYAEVFSMEMDVALEDPFGPFLYPNQYVWFTGQEESIVKGAELARPADSDLDCIARIYSFVTANVVYDKEEAETVKSGYLPEVDEVLSTGKGICIDYAALMACMLRTQRIPTRMEVGYAGTAYHAWISCYLEEVGWINNLIYFDGQNWSMMDPTLAAGHGEKKLKKFIGDGTNYRTMYLY